MPRYVASGRVEHGQLHIRAMRKMEHALMAWRDCEVTVTVEKVHATRSKPQNDYYWSVVVARVREAFRKKGIDAYRDPKLTHEVLKSQFMDPELVRLGKIRGFLSDTGLLLGTSTTELNKLQFIEYLDRIIDHAAQYWDTYIPPPDPLWREHALEEAAKEGDAA